MIAKIKITKKSIFFSWPRAGSCNFYYNRIFKVITFQYKPYDLLWFLKLELDHLKLTATVFQYYLVFLNYYSLFFTIIFQNWCPLSLILLFKLL